MEKEKKDLRQRKQELVDWVEAHKKELAIAGISITAVGLAVAFGIHNRDAIDELFVSLKKPIEKKPEPIPQFPTPILEIDTPLRIGDVPEKVIDIPRSVITRAPHDVKMHPRTLPVNRKPSPGKILQARELGIALGPNQTLVSSYRTGEMAA